jgi:thiopurine S-methyltransferase
MEQDFWTERWAEGQTGWHAGSPNRFLVEYFDRLHCATGDSVLVPLCGKSLDLGWLAAEASCRPVGVEWAEQAVAEYFADASEAVVCKPLSSEVEQWQSQGVALLRADWFAVQREHLSAATGMTETRAWWDRASLIALPPDLRVAYVAHLASLLPQGARGLLLSLEYPPEEKQGPPFSVDPDEVRRLFEADFSIEELVCEDSLARDPLRLAQGMTRLDERLYLLQKR